MVNLINNCVNPWVWNIESYIPGQMKEGYLKLASNENNYGPAPGVISALNKNLNSIHRYPYKDQQVKQKIAEYCNCDEKNILMGNGSDEIIDLIFKSFKTPAVSMFPTFSEYKIVAQILNKEYNDINLNPDFGFDAEKFIKDDKFGEAKLIFLCSPNNPTGGVIKNCDVKKICEEGQKPGNEKIVVVDEAYYEFSGKTCVNLVKEYDNLIVTRTFAKAFAIAGLRMGYAVANEDLIKSLHKVKPPFNVNVLAHAAAVAALFDVEFMKKNVEKIIKDREILMKKLNDKFNVFPTEANFILFDVSPMTADEFFNKFFEEKIIVRKFGKFEGFEGDYVRVSVGTGEENKRFIEVLDEL